MRFPHLALAVLLSAVPPLALAPSPAGAHDYTVGTLRIDHPWSRATPPGAAVGGGYMTIANDGAEPDRLVGGSTPVAESVEVHEMTLENDVMRMRRLDDGLAIPAGGSAALAPGGTHLMLVGLKQPLVEGERVPLTLTFASGASVEVELAVDAMGAGGAAEVDHSAHGAAAGEAGAHAGH